VNVWLAVACCAYELKPLLHIVHAIDRHKLCDFRELCDARSLKHDAAT
jgi:hypothetical protein